MIELELLVQSDRREGLLVELGRLVVASGYTLLRQRLSQDSRGAWLTLVVRGPAERQLPLEEALATHPRVLSFEAALAGARPAAGPAGFASAPAVPQAPAAPAPAGPGSGPDVQQVEGVLPSLARDYPKIFPYLHTLEHLVAAPARAPSLHLAGRRTGAWVYKRDYSFGARLPLADALRRIAVPALRELAQAELQGHHLHIQNSPMCIPGRPSGCAFFSGYLEGLLGDSTAQQTIFVRGLQCRSEGAGACVLEIAQ